MIYDPSVPAPRTVREVAHLITDADRTARVLVVDDEISNLRLMTEVLRRAGFTNVQSVSDASTVLDVVDEFSPDVVLLDLHMPGVDGIQLISAIGTHAGPRNFLPVLVLTGDASVQARDAALAAGAKDFLVKPYEPTEVVLRVRNLVETRLLHVELQRQYELLSEGFAARTAELEAAKLEILERLARASDFRDETTHAHTQRVGELSALIAAQLGLHDVEIEHLRIAARLHDIGKIGLSDSILQKPGPLTPAEFLEQERHTIIGANILSGSRFPILRVAEQVALTHHEAWDGSGYPRALVGHEIPLAGRIVAVADVFDALTHPRPYKRAWSTEAALDEIMRQRGRKFDPAVVDAFTEVAADYVAQQAMTASDDASAERHRPPETELTRAKAEAERVRLVRNILRSGTLR